MLYPIHHTFGPHVSFRYWLKAESLVFQPWKWKKGPATEELRKTFSSAFNGDTYFFGSGREAMLALLRSLNLGNGAEIIIQGFTCVALPNAIHAAGYTTVYADMDPNTLNMSASSVRTKITERTKAIICQHTFGIPADLSGLRALADERGILLIEDCAHILPDQKGPEGLGLKGDYVMLSFGRDKAISGVAGGAIIARKNKARDGLQKEENEAIEYSNGTIFRYLIYPDTYMAARLFYKIAGIGKVCLALCKVFKLMIPVLTSEEKKGYMPPTLHKIPHGCAALALWELKRMNEINAHRRSITAYYWEQAQRLGWKFPSSISPTLPLQKFPLYIDGAENIRQKLKKQNIHLEDGWTSAVVCPRSSDQQRANYVRGSCPFAEGAAWTLLSLPTHPTMSLTQAKKLVDILHDSLRR